MLVGQIHLRISLCCKLKFMQDTKKFVDLKPPLQSDDSYGRPLSTIFTTYSSPKNFVDVKPLFQADDYYGRPLSTIFTRYSSPIRITVITSIGTIIGTSYSIGWAMYHDAPKVIGGARGFFGSLALCLGYSVLNELFNGLVVRNYGQEQYFVSNAMATGLMTGIYYLFQKRIQQVKYDVAMKRALKYVGILSVFSMFHDVYVILRRYEYLGKNPPHVIPEPVPRRVLPEADLSDPFFVKVKEELAGNKAYRESLIKKP